MSRGTIVAETPAEIFIVHKAQLKTFFVEDEVMESLRLRAIQYPEDVELEKRLNHNVYWKGYKKKVMKAIPKARWPMQESTTEPFHAY